MNKITTYPNDGEFVAYLNGDRSKWESGKTRDEAIGKLVQTYDLGIFIETL